MSTVEDRLRDAFHADAQTVRPETIPGLHEWTRPSVSPRTRFSNSPRIRSRAVRWLVPLAAGLAVTLIAVGVSVGAGQSRPSGRPASHPAVRPGGPVALPPGAPRFYIVITGLGPPTVNATATGQVVARFRPPLGTQMSAFAATAGGRSFVVAVQQSYRHSCPSQLYSFRLNDRGQPGPLTSLHITLPGTFSNFGTLAITPDGRTIAYRNYFCGQGRDEVGLVSVATGQVKVWKDPGQALDPENLSLSADGRWLAFSADIPPELNGGRPGQLGMWRLSTRAPGGNLQPHSHIVTSGFPDWAALNSDGSSLYGCTVAPVVPMKTTPFASMTYYTYAIATGRKQIIASWHHLPQPTCWASLDPSGRYLLTEYPAPVSGMGQAATPGILDLRSGQLSRVPSTPFPAPLEITW